MSANPRITDVVARTKALVDGGASTEEIVVQLRSEGFSVVESLAGLIRAAGMTGSEARGAVVDSPTWADVRERVESHSWIEPTHPPEDDSIERLHAACDADPRIAEAWFTGRRMTRADGSVRERDGLAVVLREPFQRAEEVISQAELDLIEKIRLAAPEVDIGTWLFTTDAVASAVREHSLLIYRAR